MAGKILVIFGQILLLIATFFPPNHFKYHQLFLYSLLYTFHAHNKENNLTVRQKIRLKWLTRHSTPFQILPHIQHHQVIQDFLDIQK